MSSDPKQVDISRSMQSTGSLSGSLLIPQRPTAAQLKTLGTPQKGLSEEINDWRSDNWRHHLGQRGHPEVAFNERLISKRLGLMSAYGALFATKLIKQDDGSTLMVPLGLASLRAVTDTGVGFIVDAFQNITELEIMKYHGVGTGSTAESAAQTALVTELTTEYNPNSTRATGTTTEAAANIYQTVATNNFDATVVLREHGIFTQAATGGGVMLDRSLFSAINLDNGDGLQTDYRLTLTSGG